MYIVIHILNDCMRELCGSRSCSVVLRGANGNGAPPRQVVEFTVYPESTTGLIMPGSSVRVPPFPPIIQWLIIKRHEIAYT